MKKLAYIAMLLVMVFALTACGGLSNEQMAQYEKYALEAGDELSYYSDQHITSLIVAMGNEGTTLGDALTSKVGETKYYDLSQIEALVYENHSYVYLMGYEKPEDLAEGEEYDTSELSGVDSEVFLFFNNLTGGNGCTLGNNKVWDDICEYDDTISGSYLNDFPRVIAALELGYETLQQEKPNDFSAYQTGKAKFSFENPLDKPFEYFQFLNSNPTYAEFDKYEMYLDYVNVLYTQVQAYLDEQAALETEQDAEAEEEDTKAEEETTESSAVEETPAATPDDGTTDSSVSGTATGDQEYCANAVLDYSADPKMPNPETLLSLYDLMTQKVQLEARVANLSPAAQNILSQNSQLVADLKASNPDDYKDQDDYIVLMAQNASLKDYELALIDLEKIDRQLEALNTYKDLSSTDSIPWVLNWAEAEVNAEVAYREALLDLGSASLGTLANFYNLNNGTIAAYEKIADEIKAKYNNDASKYENDIEYIKNEMKFKDILEKEAQYKAYVEGYKETAKEKQANAEEALVTAESDLNRVLDEEMIFDAVVAIIAELEASYTDKGKADNYEIGDVAGVYWVDMSDEIVGQADEGRYVYTPSSGGSSYGGSYGDDVIINGGTCLNCGGPCDSDAMYCMSCLSDALGGGSSSGGGYWGSDGYYNPTDEEMEETWEDVNDWMEENW